MKISPSKILNFYYPMEREIPEDILKKAGDRGTYLHSKIENYFDKKAKIEEFDFDEKDRITVDLQWDNFKSEIENHDLKSAVQELEIVTKKLSGYIDFIGKYENLPTIIDWKSNSVLGKKEVEKYTLQLNLYRFMIEEVYQQTFENLYIVHLTKNKSRNKLKFIKCELIANDIIEKKINEVYNHFNNEENNAN